MSNLTWTATFDGGVTVVVWSDEWAVVSGDPESAEMVRQRIQDCVDTGWPELAGLAVDTSPGWDHDWTYLRLKALGAEVVGSWPQEAEVDMEYPPDTIIG